jgi:peptidyl-dipeptidase A
MRRFVLSAAALALAFACNCPCEKEAREAPAPGPAVVPAVPEAAKAAPTVDDAAAFVKDAEKELLDAWIFNDRTAWVNATYITDDTDLLAARAQERVMEVVGRRAAEATKFKDLPLPPDVARKLYLLRVSTPLPAPSDPAKRTELSSLATQMQSLYGKGKYCPERLGGKCLTIDEMGPILAKSRDADEQLDLWTGWHKVAPPMKPMFQRYVELGNEGARELGFADLGALWKSGYDLPPEAFEAETLRLYEQLKPFYEQLHCYVRARLGEVYGTDKVPSTGPIPAHLLGNMWAQEWGGLFDLVAPEKGSTKALDLDAALAARQLNEVGMAKIAEAFFSSLGQAPLPQTFWERSMFTRPRDREVVCHASAWDIDWVDDIRIKMCIRINEEDFVTIHHELGHNYYQRAYGGLDPLFRNSANDGFHEALGDTIALSVTPSYLKQIGLIDQLPPDSLNPLMKRALEKIAFLPFGLLIDRWRWDVFSGKTPPERYNAAWWELRRQFQGVAPAGERTEADFDPGAKYHVPANVPYTRYFLAAILQFQFHRALCRQMGHQGPLHTCSIYANREAGKRIDDMMKMGLTKPWPEALAALTGGETQMDATAILDYFAPLYDWLKAQNQGRQCGW